MNRCNSEGRDAAGSCIFAQNKIAIIWDFDKTLIPYDMQRPRLSTTVWMSDVWHESNELPEYYRARGDQLVSEQLYMLHILAYVKAGRFGGLSNALLRELGAGWSSMRACQSSSRPSSSISAVTRVSRLRHRRRAYVVSTGYAR